MPTVSEEKKSKMNRFSKMTPEDKKLCEKLMLLMYCHPDGEDFYKPIPEDVKLRFFYNPMLNSLLACQWIKC